MRKTVQRLLADAKPVPIFAAAPVGIVLVLISAMAIRSTLDHRLVNPSTVALTTDSLVNELLLTTTKMASINGNFQMLKLQPTRTL